MGRNPKETQNISGTAWHRGSFFASHLALIGSNLGAPKYFQQNNHYLNFCINVALKAIAVIVVIDTEFHFHRIWFW